MMAGECGSHGVEALIDFRDVDRGTQHPGAQQALAHRSERVVEGAEQGDGVSGAGKERLDQLQVADGDRVENQAVLALVVADAVHMVERAALGLAGVVENGSGGAGGGVVAGQAEALQREHAEVIFQQRNSVIGSEDPVVEGSLAPPRTPEIRGSQAQCPVAADPGPSGEQSSAEARQRKQRRRKRHTTSLSGAIVATLRPRAVPPRLQIPWRETRRWKDRAPQNRHDPPTVAALRREIVLLRAN